MLRIGTISQTSVKVKSDFQMGCRGSYGLGWDSYGLWGALEQMGSYTNTEEGTWLEVLGVGLDGAAVSPELWV